MRYSSIDIMRTIAIALMVLVHFMENLSGSAVWNPAGFGAPFFAFLAGVSYSIWTRSQESKKRSDETILKVSIRRGLFLIGIGFLFNVLVWLPQGTFNWDVLTYIGSSLLLLSLMRNLPPVVILLVAATVCLASPFLQKLAEYPEYWSEGYFDYDLTLSDVLIGYTVTGYFPLFPWLALPLIGFTVGKYMLDGKEFQRERTLRIGIIGAAFIALSFLLQATHSYLPEQMVVNPLKAWTMFPASLAYLAGTIGMTLFSLSLLHTFVDQNPKWNSDNPVIRVASTFSPHSLTVYLLHHIVHVWPLWIYGVLQGQEIDYYWGQAFEVTYSIPLAAIFMILCYFFLRWLDRTGRHGVEYWMRWICD
jgi:uncharacterized membrane protein